MSYTRLCLVYTIYISYIRLSTMSYTRLVSCIYYLILCRTYDCTSYIRLVPRIYDLVLCRTYSCNLYTSRICIHNNIHHSQQAYATAISTINKTIKNIKYVKQNCKIKQKVNNENSYRALKLPNLMMFTHTPNRKILTSCTSKHHHLALCQVSSKSIEKCRKSCVDNTKL
jgi:hypothetical protein